MRTIEITQLDPKENQGFSRRFVFKLDGEVVRIQEIDFNGRINRHCLLETIEQFIDGKLI